MTVIEFVLARLFPSGPASTRSAPHTAPITDAVPGRPGTGMGLAPLKPCVQRGVRVPTPPIRRDEPHAGDPNLVRWPMSLVEQQLADSFLDTGTETWIVELQAVTGSGRRAAAVLGARGRERDLLALADRAFGPEPT